MNIAMGNASKEVQSKANFVTDTNEQEGFAHAMERFVLNRTQAGVGDFQLLAGSPSESTSGESLSKTLCVSASLPNKE